MRFHFGTSEADRIVGDVLRDMVGRSKAYLLLDGGDERYAGRAKVRLTRSGWSFVWPEVPMRGGETVVGAHVPGVVRLPFDLAPETFRDRGTYTLMLEVGHTWPV